MTLGPDLGVAGASADDIYAAMDWLTARQDDIEKQLAARHLHQGGFAMSGLSSSWVEGAHLRAGRLPVLPGRQAWQGADRVRAADRQGRPAGGCAGVRRQHPDPKAFPEAVEVVRGTFALEKMIMVGDRGMISSARIKDPREMEGMAWLTCLRHPAIKKLMAGDGPLQLSLFDEQDLAEITSGDFPG